MTSEDVADAWTFTGGAQVRSSGAALLNETLRGLCSRTSPPLPPPAQHDQLRSHAAVERSLDLG